MKISLGMITKDLLTKEPLDQFLENAKKFNHKLYSIVIAYSDKLDESVVRELREEIEVHLIKIKSSNILYNQLNDLGMTKKSMENLIGNISEDFDGRAPYGQNRNHVILESMLKGSDVLIFIDTDVYPEVIVKKENSKLVNYRESGIPDVIIEEVDFIGNHLEFLKDDGIAVTTSDYTGFYIIPPMKFDGMEELFKGLKKEAAFDYIKNSYGHKCLCTDHGINRRTFKTDKVLGGNVAIKLDVFEEIIPFFSTTYEVNGNKYLTRGEDTVLAIQMESIDRIFYDIDMKIFHNTYSDFPKVPNIEVDKHIKDRFFYACMGWIGRNPFLNYLHNNNIYKVYRDEHKNLIEGSKAIAKYLNDDRFLELPKAHEVSYKNLDSVIKEFDEFRNSWLEFIELYRRRKNENIDT